jgi:NADP-dependent 3-hydroxy acid dehydrogenase YdfG
VVESELAEMITHAETAAMMRDWRPIALEPDAIACAVRFAIQRPEDVDV